MEIQNSPTTALAEQPEPEYAPLHPYRLVVVGPPHNLAVPEEFIRKLLTERLNVLKSIMVFTMNTKEGLGFVISKVCNELKIPRVDFHLFFDNVGDLYREIAYIARQSAFVYIGEEFHIFIPTTRISGIEDLVDSVRNSGLPMTVYGQYGIVHEKTEEETRIRSL